jgi:hypothetical protein
MSDLIVVGFKGEDTADSVLHKVVALSTEPLIDPRTCVSSAAITMGIGMEAGHACGGGCRNGLGARVDDSTGNAIIGSLGAAIELGSSDSHTFERSVDG